MLVKGGQRGCNKNLAGGGKCKRRNKWGRGVKDERKEMDRHKENGITYGSLCACESEGGQ